MNSLTLEQNSAKALAEQSLNATIGVEPHRCWIQTSLRSFTSRKMYVYCDLECLNIWSAVDDTDGGRKELDPGERGTKGTTDSTETENAAKMSLASEYVYISCEREDGSACQAR